jgi:hypothetical protein
LPVVQNRLPERILLRRFRQPQKFLDYLGSEYISVATLPSAEADPKDADPPIRQYISKSAPQRPSR